MKTFALIVVCFALASPGICQFVQEGKIVVLINERHAKNTFFTESKKNGRSEFKFVHEAGARLFSKFNITKIERTYAVIRDDETDPLSEKLKRYYTITGNFRRDKMILNIVGEGNDFFENVEPVPVAVTTKLTPNDYTTAFSPNDAMNQIGVRLAWDITTSNSNVKIAISDIEGFYFDHPDYVNSNSTNQVVYKHSSSKDQSNGDAAPAHGLFVASAAAAATNNGIGVTGVGYDSKIMAFGGAPFGSDLLGNMIIAARDHHAKIINASWGRCGTFDQSEQDAINQIHNYGALVVFSAGNGDCPSSDGQGNGLQWPASYNKVLAVGGVTTNNRYLNGSQHLTFNSSVDVTAPGWSIPVAAAALIDTGPTNVFDHWDYLKASGTSIAAPIVCGIAALCLGIEPNLTNNQLERIIKGSVTNINNEPGNSVYASVSGTGRVDAAYAAQNTKACFACTEVSAYPAIIEDEFIGTYYGIPQPVSACKMTVGTYSTTASQTLALEATRQIRLLPGFTAVAGSTVTLKIDARCVNYMDSTSFNGARKGSNQNEDWRTYREILESGEIQVSDEEFYYPESSYTVSHFPNPTIDDFIIDYYLPQDGQVEINLTDINGSIVKRIADEYQSAGSYQKKVTTSSLARGLYLYTITVNGWKETKKIVLVE